MVSHHIRGKKPQPLRKHPAVLPKSRHPIRRQMKQNRRHIPQRQIRIPIQNTRRKPQLNNPAGQIPPRDLTTLLSPPRKIKKLSPRNIPQIHIHKPLNNLPSPPRLKRRIQKRQNHIITQTTHSPSKTQAAPKKTTLKTRPTNLRSPSPKPHQHTSEAHHTTLINTHPKLFSQVTSAYIRSSSLKPHQHTSEALLSSPTKQSPKLRISINQSISQPQPIRPTIFFHNYNPKYSKNKFKYYTKTPHPIQNSLYPQSPHDKPQKNSPHPHPAQRRCHTPLVDCLSVRSSLPPFIPQKKSPQAQTPGNSPKTKQHHLPLRSFLSSLSNRSARAFSLNVFTLSSLRPCSIP